MSFGRREVGDHRVHPFDHLIARGMPAWRDAVAQPLFVCGRAVLGFPPDVALLRAVMAFEVQ